MISLLNVTNFALISKLELELTSGFSVITGETGSGKSILLGALELLLGERADFSLIGKDGDKAVVEATVSLAAYDLKDFFAENDLDYSDETIIRREISNNGRSRAFVNDSPVQLNVLRDLSARLVNIHSQYNTLELRDKNYQLQLLDVLADLLPQRKLVAEKFSEYKLMEAERAAKQSQLDEIQKQHDYIQFQLEEIDELNLESNDFAAMEAELNRAENAEQIIRTLGLIEDGISGDGGALELFLRAKSELDKLKSLDEQLGDFSERTNSLWLELKELAADVSSYAERLEINPGLKELMLSKLDNYNRILRKHNLKNQDELVTLQRQFLGSTKQTEALESEIVELSSRCEIAKNQLIELADRLHEGRTNATSEIEATVQQLLSELKLDGTRLQFQLTKKELLTTTGFTEISILFSANKGIEMVPIEKAASGGELSRVMLALQKLVSDKKALPTVLFDEIDTGVSGEVAQKMGNLLRRMGESRQLIAITHLPQVAAKAKEHFKVEKVEQGGRTQSSVRKLNPDQAVEEVARLMSGEQISEAALQTAKALIDG